MILNLFDVYIFFFKALVISMVNILATAEVQLVKDAIIVL